MSLTLLRPSQVVRVPLSFANTAGPVTPTSIAANLYLGTSTDLGAVTVPAVTAGETIPAPTVPSGAAVGETYYLRVAYAIDAVNMPPLWLPLGRVDATADSRLAPTVAGRTLDVSATGEAGIDWGNVGSQGALVGLSNSSIGSATTIGSTGRTAIAAAVWDALTSGIVTVGAIGKLIVDNLDAKMSSRHSASQATQDATNILAAIQAVPGLVWAATTRTLSGFGSLVADIVSAVTAAILATPANKLLTDAAGHVTAVNGGGGGGSGDAEQSTLLAVKAKTDLIGSAAAKLFRAPVTDRGELPELIQGDDYTEAIGRALAWAVPASTWGDLTGATVTFAGKRVSGIATIGPVVGSVKNPNTEDQLASVDLASEHTAVEPGRYRWQTQVTYPGGAVATRIVGEVDVIADLIPATA